MTAYDFEVKTDVQWPRIARQTNGAFVTEPIQFPPTVVSAKVTGQRTLVLENPTDLPIIIQPILLGDLNEKYKLEAALKDDYPFLGMTPFFLESLNFGLGIFTPKFSTHLPRFVFFVKLVSKGFLDNFREPLLNFLGKLA